MFNLHNIWEMLSCNSNIDGGITLAKVAFLVHDKFEDSEMKNPYDAIKEAGHEAVIIGLEKNSEIKGKNGTTYKIDEAVKNVSGKDFDALVLPGGGSPEGLRNNDDVVHFTKEINGENKTIAGICHGPQIMISADILQGKSSTCFPGIRDDVKLAGANYEDKEVVVSSNLITSRTPDDEPAFIREILNKL